MSNKSKYYMDYYNFLEDPLAVKLTSVGNQVCKPGHSNGPKIREHLLFHYIVSGKGVFKINDTTYELHAGQGFFIPDTSIIYYKADEEDPWHYCWMIVSGPSAQSLFNSIGLSKTQPIYNAKANNNIYESFLSLLESGKSYSNIGNNTYDNISLYYNVFKLLSEIKKNSLNKPIISSSSIEVNYSDLAIQYIHDNYRREDFTISKIADNLNIDRSYLSRLFHINNELSPKEYLIKVRLSEATRLLEATDLPIEIISHSVGYTDVFNFSKIFKKFYGVSPSIYRKKYNLK